MFKSVLLPIDLSQESSWKEAIPVAMNMAKDSGAKLHVFTVIPDYGMAVVGSFFPTDYAKNALGETEKLLAEFIAHLIASALVRTTCSYDERRART